MKQALAFLVGIAASVSGCAAFDGYVKPGGLKEGTSTVLGAVYVPNDDRFTSADVFADLQKKVTGGGTLSFVAHDPELTKVSPAVAPAVGSCNERSWVQAAAKAAGAEAVMCVALLENSGATDTGLTTYVSVADSDGNVVLITSVGGFEGTSGGAVGAAKKNNDALVARLSSLQERAKAAGAAK